MPVAAGRKSLLPVLAALLTLLAGHALAADGDGLAVEDQLYITAGLIGGLAFILTIAVVYLLLTLSRVQSTVFTLSDTVTEAQEQLRKRPATTRVEDTNGEECSGQKPDQLQLTPKSSPEQASPPQPEPQQQSEPITQQLSQAMTQQQPQPVAQQQVQPMPQSAFRPQSQQGPQPQLTNHMQNSYQQQQVPQQQQQVPQQQQHVRQQPYAGGPQRPATAMAINGGVPGGGYRFPAQPPQNRPPSQQFGQSRPISQPAPYFINQTPRPPNPYVSSGPVYPQNRY